MFRPFALALALAVAGSAAAAEPDPDCDTATFPSDLGDGLALATVNTAKAAFLRNGDGCPDLGESCMTKGFVVSGDSVVTAQARGSYRCAAFAGRHSQTTGWMRQEELSPAKEAPTGDWAGRWKRVSGSSILNIRRHGASYQADMLATAATANPDNVRTGVASGEMRISGNLATFGDPGDDRDIACRVAIRRLGSLLLVNDGGTADANSACDGMGVTLNGIYRR